MIRKLINEKPERCKSGLITNTPFYLLCDEDKQKLLQLDKRYTELLHNDPEKSYIELRKTIFPYIFRVNETNITILASTKKEAIEKLGHDNWKNTNKVSVEYLEWTRKLTSYETEKQKRKARVAKGK